MNAQRKISVTTDEYKEAEISFAPGSAATPLADAALCGAAFGLEVGLLQACVHVYTPDPYISNNI